MECSLDMECSIDMNIQHGHGMQYGNGHAAWTWTCRMDMDMQDEQGHAARILRHGPGQWTCMDAWMPECGNAEKSSVRHR
jgi:hypothetical protein